MKTYQEYYPDVEEVPTGNWIVYKDILLEDYISRHIDMMSKRKIDLINSWLFTFLLEDVHKEKPNVNRKKKKTMYEKGSAEALISLFGELERSEELASSIEDIIKWTRSVKPKEISL